MKLKRYKEDINESSGVMFFADSKPKVSEDNEKFEIIERLSKHWNEKLKSNFLVPRSLYGYTLTDLKRIEKFYLNENNEFCDFGCNYISKFVEEHPEYDNESFFEFVASKNLADRDMGELQDISGEEIERLSKEWKPLKETIELDSIDKNNIHQAWEYVKSHITKDDVENMVIKLKASGMSDDNGNFNLYNFAITRLIGNIFGGGESESLLRIENDLAKYLGYTFETQLDILDKQGYPNKIKPLNESKEDLERLHDIIGGTTDNTKPSIFQYTIYRLPTEEELNEFAEFPNLTAKDIEKGFGYTIIGRGMASPKNKQMIINSIQMLIERYPENDVYKEALELAKKEKVRTTTFDDDSLYDENYNPKLIEVLHELKQQHATNEAVEDIRIEDDEIVFDVKCETDIQGVSEYNGIKLRFNKLCDIYEHSEKSEDEIIEHAKMIKESCINDYLSSIKLNESPDNITLLKEGDKKRIQLDYDVDQAKPFAFVIKGDFDAKNKLTPDQLGELWIGNWKEGHSKHCPFLNSDINYGDLFLGRLWFESNKRKNSYPVKIISFWYDLRNNKELLQEVVNRIEKADKDLDMTDWSLDTMQRDEIEDGRGNLTFISRVIPLKDMGITFLTDSQKDDSGEVFKKIMKKRTPLMYRQAIYGENTTYNFEEFLKRKDDDEEV